MLYAAEIAIREFRSEEKKERFLSLRSHYS